MRPRLVFSSYLAYKRLFSCCPFLKGYCKAVLLLFLTAKVTILLSSSYLAIARLFCCCSWQLRPLYYTVLFIPGYCKAFLLLFLTAKATLTVLFIPGYCKAFLLLLLKGEATVTVLFLPGYCKAFLLLFLKGEATVTVFVLYRRMEDMSCKIPKDKSTQISVLGTFPIFLITNNFYLFYNFDVKPVYCYADICSATHTNW